MCRPGSCTCAPPSTATNAAAREWSSSGFLCGIRETCFGFFFVFVFGKDAGICVPLVATFLKCVITHSMGCGEGKNDRPKSGGRGDLLLLVRRGFSAPLVGSYRRRVRFNRKWCRQALWDTGRSGRSAPRGNEQLQRETGGPGFEDEVQRCTHVIGVTRTTRTGEMFGHPPGAVCLSTPRPGRWNSGTTGNAGRREFPEARPTGASDLGQRDPQQTRNPRGERLLQRNPHAVPRHRDRAPSEPADEIATLCVSTKKKVQIKNKMRDIFTIAQKKHHRPNITSTHNVTFMILLPFGFCLQGQYRNRRTDPNNYVVQLNLKTSFLDLVHKLSLQVGTDVRLLLLVFCICTDSILDCTMTFADKLLKDLKMGVVTQRATLRNLLRRDFYLINIYHNVSKKNQTAESMVTLRRSEHDYTCFNISQ